MTKKNIEEKLDRIIDLLLMISSSRYPSVPQQPSYKPDSHGYTCYKCGKWVSNYEQHICSLSGSF